MSPRRCARPLSNCKGSGKNSRSSLVLAHGGGIKFASTSTRAEAFSISRDDCVGRNGCIEFPATAWPGRRQSVDRGRCDRSEYAGRRTRARRREHSSHDSLRRLQAPFCGWPHYRRFVPRYILLSHGSRRNEEMGRHTAPHQISCNLLRVLPIWLLSEHPAGVRRSARHGIHALACVGDAEQLRVGLGRERLPGRKRTVAESWQPATIRGTKTKSRLIAAAMKRLACIDGVAKEAYLSPDFPVEPTFVEVGLDAATFCRISFACFRWPCKVGSVCDAKSLRAGFCPPLASLLKSAISSSWSFTMS